MDEPIGQAAVADFTVIPGPDANPDHHAVLGTEFDKTAHVALPRPVKLALDFFVVNPEDVGRDHLDPACLHFQNFFFPSGFRIAGEMEFAHHRKPGLAIAREIAAVGGENVAVRGLSANGKAQGFRGLGPIDSVDYDRDGSRLIRAEHRSRENNRTSR